MAVLFPAFENEANELAIVYKLINKNILGKDFSISNDRDVYLKRYCASSKNKSCLETVDKIIFAFLEGEENRSWINFEDLLRSLPILLFYSLHVRL